MERPEDDIVGFALSDEQSHLGAKDSPGGGPGGDHRGYWQVVHHPDRGLADGHSACLPGVWLHMYPNVGQGPDPLNAC